MKVRCRGCRQYREKDEMVPVGLGYVCGPDCVKLVDTRTRRSRKPKDDVPRAVRERVLARDGGNCRWCGCRARSLHHIHYRSEGESGPHEDWNLVTLCQKHHDIAHSNKKKWQPILVKLIEFGDMGKWLTVPEVEKRLEHDR
jgi:5-methylcytosine-specific restriction endonuclease McrA